jgi:hypothetical protein
MEGAGQWICAGTYSRVDDCTADFGWLYLADPTTVCAFIHRYTVTSFASARNNLRAATLRYIHLFRRVIHGIGGRLGV